MKEVFGFGSGYDLTDAGEALVYHICAGDVRSIGVGSDFVGRIDVCRSAL